MNQAHPEKSIGLFFVFVAIAYIFADAFRVYVRK